MSKRVNSNVRLIKIILGCLLVILTSIGNVTGVKGNRGVGEGKSDESWAVSDPLQYFPANHKPPKINDASVFPPSLSLRRSKRDKDGQHKTNNETQSEEEEDDDVCIMLPPKPPRSSSSSPKISINLMNLLNDGSSYMADAADSIKDAILLLGNTGAGKTTLTQIIAGNLNRIHAVVTQSEELVIVDDDNRIGVPTTISKTLVPELVFKQNGNDMDDADPMNMTAFYDCPGFDDTRGPEQDIAANFFVNQVVRKVSRVKLIFLVIQSSVKAGHDRLDFDLLVSHATKFLKNIPNYRKSIGLVVTKVDSYNHRGKFLSGENIVKGIVEFLQNYNQTLNSQLEADTGNGDLERKIQFVEALLEKDGNENYGRISFSRSPVKCGPLSNSKMIARTKERMIKLYSEGLEYTPVDWRDFGYTLKDKTKLTLRGYVRSLNEQVEAGLSALMNDFRNWAHSKYLQTTDMNLVTNDMKKVVGALETLVTSLNTLRNGSSPKIFLEVIRPVLEELGYSLSIKVERYMSQQQAYFDWFDEVNAGPVTRSVRDWIGSVENTKKEFVELREWYDFCKELQTRVGTYDWQLYKPRMPRGDVGNWLDFLERESHIPVRNSIRALDAKLDGIHTEVIEKILRFALKPAELKCEGDVATITGNYVRLAEFVSSDWSLFLENCENDDEMGHNKHLEIYAAHTIFIDEDVEAEGHELNLVMIAPNWVVVGGNKHINLNGFPAPKYSVMNVEDGEAMAGKPGGPGGSFFGLALNTKDIGRLEITSIGGQGGNGQHGRDGRNGTTDWTPDFEDAPSYETWNFIVYKYTKHKHEGYPGHSGSSGGDGGAAGIGGKPGKIKFMKGEKSETASNGLPRIIREYGKMGKPGLGGEGGYGARHSEGIHCTRRTIFFGLFGDKRECEKRRYKFDVSPQGPHGVDGASVAGLVRPISLTYSIVEWRSILEFKFSAGLDLTHNETAAFVQFLEGDPDIRSYFEVEGYAKELEGISERNLESLLPSYISRVEEYAKANFKMWRKEKRKVVGYLLASAYSSLVVSEQNRGMGMVVDLAQFFNVVEKHMEKMKKSSALVAIEEETSTFGKNIKGKIGEVRRFQNEVVTPAIHTAEIELQSHLRNLETQFEKLILESEGNLDLNRNRLTIGIQQEETLKFKQIMGLVGAIATLTDLIGGAFGIVESGLPIIWDSTIGLFTSFKAFAHGVQDMGDDDQGAGLRTVLSLGGELLESAANFTETLEMTLSEIGEVANGIGSGNGDSTGRSNNNNNNITDMITYFGEELISNLNSKFAGDSPRLSRLNRFVKEAEEKLKDARKRKHEIQKSFIPVVKTLSSSLGWMMADLQNKSDTSTVEASELDIRKWQITRVLKDTKSQLEMLGKGVETREFLNAIDRVQDSLTMQIDLIEDIVKYEETWKLTNYMASLNSASLKNIQVSDPILSASIGKMEKAMAANQFKKEYQRALHAFKQWVFPFAKLHLTRDLQIGRDETGGDAYVKQVESLKLKWEMYKGTTLGAHDTHLIHTNFSSSHRSSSPFFTWKNERWSQDIYDFLSGKPVHLKADVRLSQKGKDAVKFKLIELNCKIPDGKKTQSILDSELAHFAVVMTHSGVSYYRFQGKFYVMTGANQTIQYNFERDLGSGGNRLGTNRIYEKFKRGDYLLSPYTLWTIQLIRASPRNSRSGQNRFQSLERFAPYVDLELVGTGIYVQGDRMREDMEVEKYYVRDDSVREDLDLLL